ncbi:MAG TPA: beta-galactosidase, partial [Candidatus Sulfopaludibacter sp.]|nr:beta-galactosidase [Candidatus Sulfopaludibacter sp.]
MIRALALLAALAAAASPAADRPAPEFVQAVEFPYYLYPRDLWDRELAWLKNIGVRTVKFSIPWNWHQLSPGEFDLTGRTSPRRDLQGFVRLLRRLGLRAWIRPLPPVANWPNEGRPADADARAEAAWRKALEEALATQTLSHGGPIEWMEGRGPALGAAAPPGPIRVLSAMDASAFLRSRNAIASGRGTLLWQGVEDSLYPAGWENPPGSLLRLGAVGLSGDERPAAMGLRRDAALLRNWSALLPAMQPAAMPKPTAGQLPQGVTAVELVSQSASAVCLTNAGAQPFHDELRVFEPVSKRALVIPSVSVLPGESLWLPVSVSIGQNGLCRECSNFSSAEQIVYATAELLGIEYENGILAMEFAAPEGGEAILQLERQPVGPFLAAGKPSKFEWDDKALRARLTIPANPAGDHHVRIGLAMEEPETSAFLNEAHRLVIGQKNILTATFSSPGVAARSRMRLPEGYAAAARNKTPNEIEYEIAVPADAVRGDFANLALEADGVLLGRARLPLFRPLSVRMMDGLQLHIGQHTEMTPDPPVVFVEPRAGTNLDVLLRNNWPGIQTFHIEAGGEGLDFFPPKSEISIGAVDERRFSLRIFARDGVSGLREWRLKASGPSAMDLPMRVVLMPRGRTVVWSGDLDGDGSAEWVLESPRARAIFSSQDGGRWMEF